MKFLLLLPLLFAAGLASAQNWTTRQAAEISEWKLNEISGMAPSRVRGDILWLHNDSGDKARVYAVHTNGTFLGTVQLDGVRAVDWEDMASATIGGTNLLALGDIGDNRRRRKEIAVHLLVEPSLPPATQEKGKIKPWTRTLAPLRSLRFVYPDGPRDAEGLVLDPVNRQILILSKRDKPPRLYSAPLNPAATPNGQPSKLTFRAKLPVPIWPSGLDLDQGNRRFVACTLNQLFLFERGPAEAWPAAFARGPVVIKRQALHQAESVCFSRDGRQIWSGSEKLPSPLLLSSRVEK